MKAMFKDVISKLTPSKKGEVTLLVVEYDCGFANQLTIRGDGAGLCWNQGIPLKNIDSTHWEWSPKKTFHVLQFKILINDQRYEEGENHTLHQGDTYTLTPQFSHV